MILIDGKKISLELQSEIANEVKEMVAKGKKQPHLAAILVGDDPASQTYVGSKVKACENVGFKSTLVTFEAYVSEQKLLSKIEELNNDDDIDGYIVQLPLPKHIDEQKIIMAIDYRKDVDGFHPINVGKLAIGEEHLLPCTPFGCIKMLELADIEIAGKHAVIIGRSNIVGKPMANLLLSRHATVTICHSRTKDLTSITRQADILVVAIGKANFVTQEMVKPGAVVIDVGINRIGEKKLVGDVDFEQVKEVAGAITPVPGGVGLLTIAMLLSNTITAVKLQQNSKE